MKKRIINSDEAPAPVGPYNHANVGCNLMFISGQVALDPDTKELITDSIEAETEQVLLNLGAILRSAGLGFNDILKCSVFVTDMGQYGRINEVYAQYFEEDTAPARELVQVAGLPLGANIEISAIALSKSQ